MEVDDFNVHYENYDSSSAEETDLFTRPWTLIDLCYESIRKNTRRFNKARIDQSLPPKLQVKLMHRAMLTLRRSQKNHPLGFTGAKLEQMCKLVNLFLNNQLLQLTLPKCGITRQHSVNVECSLSLLQEVVKRAPNLLELQVPCEPEVMAERGVAQQILHQVLKMTQLQALDMPQFFCSVQDVTNIANQLPNLSYLNVTFFCFVFEDAILRDGVQEAVDALAQMPRLRHLLFEMQPWANLGSIVAACLRRMPLLRRCGRPVDLRRCEDFLTDDFLIHEEAMRYQSASGGPPLQLEELSFHNFPEPQISDETLRMPNLRNLKLRLFSYWRPGLMNLLQNVTELGLVVSNRDVAMQILTAIGPQLTKVSFMQTPRLLLGDVFGACPNLEEAHWLNMPRSVTDDSPPIRSEHLQRLRALTLRQGDSYPLSLNGATVASLLLAAPLLERIFLENVHFEDVTVVELTAEVGAGVAFQSLRFICVNDGRGAPRELMEVLLLRMRAVCPLFEHGLVSPHHSGRDKCWEKYFCDDISF